MKAGRVLAGLGLVIVGSLFLADRADALDVPGLIADWWPLVIVALGLWQLAYDRRAVLGATVIVMIGLVLLAFTTGLLDPSILRLAWPIAIVVLGLWILVGRPAPRTRSAAAGESDAFVAFGSERAVVDGEAYEGGAATVLAGQLDVDLTKTTPVPGGAEMAATVIIGGLDVTVPPGWDVRVSGLPLLGGWDNTTRPTAGGDAPALRIKALVVMGGLEVRYAERWS